MKTLTEVLTPYGLSAADQALADIEVPIPDKAQRQGDLLFLPTLAHELEGRLAKGETVGVDGVNLVVGEATGNAHILDAPDGGVTFYRSTEASTTAVGWIVADKPFYVLHTDEHGANGFAAGTWTVRGKREMAEVERRVAD